MYGLTVQQILRCIKLFKYLDIYIRLCDKYLSLVTDDMGCNTSKEPIPTTEEKENDINIADDKNMKENNVNSGNENKSEEKPVSSKTITLGSAKKKLDPSVIKTKVSEAINGVEEDLEQAATKIQAVFRGHKTRKSMKQADKPNASTDATEDLANEFKPDDPELCNAATKIQASFRGHMARKKIADKDDEGDEKGDEKQHPNDEEEEFDFDMADPELNKAATKIQATFRSHMKHGNKDE